MTTHSRVIRPYILLGAGMFAFGVILQLTGLLKQSGALPRLFELLQLLAQVAGCVLMLYPLVASCPCRLTLMAVFLGCVYCIAIPLLVPQAKTFSWADSFILPCLGSIFWMSLGVGITAGPDWYSKMILALTFSFINPIIPVVSGLLPYGTPVEFTDARFCGQVLGGFVVAIVCAILAERIVLRVSSPATSE